MISLHGNSAKKTFNRWEMGDILQIFQLLWILLWVATQRNSEKNESKFLLCCLVLTVKMFYHDKCVGLFYNRKLINRNWIKDNWSSLDFIPFIWKKITCNSVLGKQNCSFCWTLWLPVKLFVIWFVSQTAFENGWWFDYMFSTYIWENEFNDDLREIKVL